MSTKIIETTDALLRELKAYPGNARRGDVDLIRESLRANGQYKPVVVQASTGYVLAGNHTVEAARAEGWDSILVSYVDCDDDTARRINLVDNKANDVAGYDDTALAELLVALDGDYHGTGWTDSELTDLLESLEASGRARDKDAAPKLSHDPTTRLGDVIELGPHRLVCGDALNPDDREALLQGVLPDLVLTDPPYTVSYEANLAPIHAKHRRQDGKKVTGDNLSGVEADLFVSGAMKAIHDSLKPGGVFYCFAPPGVDELRFRLGLVDARLDLRQVILWIKDVFVFGRQDYQWRHESMLYGWRDGAKHYFAGDYSQDTLWDCARPRSSEDHPTQKPVALLERAITNSSRRGEFVLDLFGGSGSTLIACQATSRRCLMMELDPSYCDVVVERWEKLTGEAVR